MEAQGVRETLKKYIEETIISDSEVNLEFDTPLLDWGILNSLSTTKLVGFVRDHFGVEVPPGEMVGENFRDLTAISGLICRIDEATGDRAKEDGRAGR